MPGIPCLSGSKPDWLTGLVAACVDPEVCVCVCVFVSDLVDGLQLSAINCDFGLLLIIVCQQYC